MTILDGKTIAADIRARVKAEIAALGRMPGLGVVLVGTDPASVRYVALKEKACAEAGIAFVKAVLPASATQQEVEAAITAFNRRDDIHAILLQIPLPAGLDESAAVAVMDPTKDVDGFHAENIRLLLAGTPRIVPVLVKGILRLMDAPSVPLAGKQVVVFANSSVFTDPLRYVLEERGMRVTTLLGKNLADTGAAVAEADVVIAAVGKPKYLRAKDCKDGVLLIDVGANTLPDGGYVGDIDATDVEDKPGWITPVPGGVGPMTVAMILENVLTLAKRS